MNSFYSAQELISLGLKSYGRNVRISKKASLYSPSTIELGDNVRIDDFCILSGHIEIGNNVHIAAGSKLYGSGGIKFSDYSGCSADCVIYSATDDFSGKFMIGPMAPDSKRHLIIGCVIIERYAQLGARTVVMPGLKIREGAVTGANTFVNRNLDAWCIYIGTPCKYLKDRSKKLLSLL